MSAVTLTKPDHIYRTHRLRRDCRDAAAVANASVLKWKTDHLASSEAGMLEIDGLIRTGTTHGWNHHYERRYRGSDLRESLNFTRPGECLRLGIESTVESVWGNHATGPVSSRHVDQTSWIRIEEIAAMLATPAHADYPPTEWVLVIGPGYVERRGYETACNYAQYRVEPGIYPVELVDSDCRANPQPGVDGRQPYWALAHAPSTKFHDYYVNTLGSHSSLRESWDESPATTSMRIYSYQLDNHEVTELPADLTSKAVYIRRCHVPEDYQVPAQDTADAGAQQDSTKG